MTKGQSLKLLKQCLNDTRHNVDMAVRQVEKAQRQLDAGELPAADGHFALRKALKSETMARRQFCEMLQLYRLAHRERAS